MTEAVYWAELSAVKGHVGAQVFMAEAYETGDGVARDLEKASIWRLLAAKAGDPDSLFRVGEIFERGEGLDVDPAEAAKHYSLAAAAGRADAVERLEAMRAAGEPEATFFLAAMYEFGEGVEIDEGRAEGLYREAADAGLAKAANDLGGFYETREEFAKAAAWYGKAGDAGFTLGFANLGALMLDGRGVAQDHAEAARLFRLSAEGGDALGMYNYARLLGRGEGVARDLREAYYWARRADANAPPKQIERYLPMLLYGIGGQLSEADLAAIEARLKADAE